MGNWYSRYYANPAGTPSNEVPPSFDPLYGFPNGRKERGILQFFQPFPLVFLQSDVLSLDFSENFSEKPSNIKAKGKN